MLRVCLTGSQRIVHLMCVAALFYSASSVLLWGSLPTHTSLPSTPHTFFCKQDSVYLKGFLLLHIQIRFLILFQWISCEDGVYLRQSNEKRSTFWLERSSVTVFLCLCVCAHILSKKQWFSTETLWSCGVLLFMGWQTQWCLGGGRLGKR